MDRAELARLLGAPAGLVAEARPEAAVIEESDPQRFMSALAAATAQGGVVMLASEAWGAQERRQLAGLRAQAQTTPATAAGKGWLCLPTGGTSGSLKFARHDEETISAAVRGFTQHFKLSRVNAAGVLPLYHVSGFMAWMRCVLTGGEYRPLDWKGTRGRRAAGAAGEARRLGDFARADATGAAVAQCACGGVAGKIPHHLSRRWPGVAGAARTGGGPAAVAGLRHDGNSCDGDGAAAGGIPAGDAQQRGGDAARDGEDRGRGRDCRWRRLAVPRLSSAMARPVGFRNRRLRPARCAGAPAHHRPARRGHHHGREKSGARGSRGGAARQRGISRGGCARGAGRRSGGRWWSRLIRRRLPRISTGPER